MEAPEQRTDVSRRIWNWIWQLDVLLFIVQIAAAIFAGFFVVGGWIIRLWETQAWWHLFLLSSLSLFLHCGFLIEVRERRVGPFGVFLIGFALIFGARHLLDTPVS